LVSDQKRTRLFAWYSLAGSLATAIGALCSGTVVQIMHGHGASPFRSYQTVVLGYAAIGLLLMLLFRCLTVNMEITPRKQSLNLRPLFGLHQSRAVVLKLSGLFALDAFAGGFIIQSILAYWFYRRFGLQPAVLGSIFFGANLMAGLSSLTAGRLASRFGLINTMVFTHIPSNVLLMLVPLMPSLPWAIAVLLLRFSISQMDVPTRQSYTMAVVSPDERSAASGVTSIARSFGAMLTPAISGQLLAFPALMGFPFYLAGGLKIVYDLLLFGSFRSRKPPEETVSN
jgi:MFS family permease